MFIFYISPSVGRHKLRELLDKVPKEYTRLSAVCYPKFFQDVTIYFCIQFDTANVSLVTLGRGYKDGQIHYHAWKGSREDISLFLKNTHDGANIYVGIQKWLESKHLPEIPRLEDALNSIQFKGIEHVLKLSQPKVFPGRYRKPRYSPEDDKRQTNFFNLVPKPKS